MVSNMVQHPSSWFVDPWRWRWRALKRLGTTYRVMQFCDPQLHCFESLKTCTFLSSIKAYRKSQQDATVSQNLLFHVYVKLNMFRAKHRPSSGAQNCTSSLWFCIRERLLDVEVAGRCPATSTSNNISRMQNQRLLVKLCSWWWAVCHPKHVELYINMK